MRKYPSLGQQIASVMRPILNGRVDVALCGYVFSDAGFTNQQGVFFKPFVDDNGMVISLARRRTVRCPSAEKGASAPQLRGFHFIPESKCKKCEHRLPRGCCALLRAKARGEQS